MRQTIVAACVLAASAAVRGDLIIPLDGGWQATVLDDAIADLSVDYLGDDLLVIEKFADFWEIDDVTGLPAPIRILFEQVAPDEETVSRIAITDEIILNHTGMHWIDFHLELLGPQATWNPADSADFSHEPFTTMEFSDELHGVDFYGGPGIPPDGIWTPGAESGALFLDVDLSGDEPVSFILKEFPTIPAPAGLALFGLAGVVGARRRRT
ncbi:MAG: hypothetical protein SYC29_07630 [Planctomycetota bacterium]|nr:hypothetical protein [Planctomycetota bacterium]